MAEAVGFKERIRTEENLEERAVINRPSQGLLCLEAGIRGAVCGP